MSVDAPSYSKMTVLGTFFPSLLEVMLSAYELKALRIELNNELIYERIMLQFYIFCNRDHDQGALISLTSDSHFCLVKVCEDSSKYCMLKCSVVCFWILVL